MQHTDWLNKIRQYIKRNRDQKPSGRNAFTHNVHEAHGLIKRAKVSQATSSSDFHDRALRVLGGMPFG